MLERAADGLEDDIHEKIRFTLNKKQFLSLENG